MIAMLSLCSSFTVLSYILSYKFADSFFSRRQNTRCVFQQLEAGVTPEAESLGAALFGPEGPRPPPAKHARNPTPIAPAWLDPTAALARQATCDSPSHPR